MVVKRKVMQNALCICDTIIRCYMFYECNIHLDWKGLVGSLGLLCVKDIFAIYSLIHVLTFYNVGWSYTGIHILYHRLGTLSYIYININWLQMSIETLKPIKQQNLVLVYSLVYSIYKYLFITYMKIKYFFSCNFLGLRSRTSLA